MDYISVTQCNAQVKNDAIESHVNVKLWMRGENGTVPLNQYMF